MIELIERQVVARGVNPLGEELVVQRGMSIGVYEELQALPVGITEPWLKETTITYLRTVSEVSIDAEVTEIAIYVCSFNRPDTERGITLIGTWETSGALGQSFIFDLVDIDEVDAYIEQQKARMT